LLGVKRRRRRRMSRRVGWVGRGTSRRMGQVREHLSLKVPELKEKVGRKARMGTRYVTLCSGRTGQLTK